MIVIAQSKKSRYVNSHLDSVHKYIWDFNGTVKGAMRQLILHGITTSVTPNTISLE